ncbi:sensor histidine kinase [Streptomyces olivaceiscleroticus]|uniref:histidine kinase n=1 Tax=Streptomyces olivaceiscleroticus TaxID=68245 RepID=A0ABN1AR66_9ACTN
MKRPRTGAATTPPEEAGTGGARWFPGPAGLPLAGAAAMGALSLVSPWCALPTAVCAYLAGRRPGRTRTVAMVLIAALAAGVLVVSVLPAGLSWGSRFVAVLAGAVMLPWFAGRFRRQYRDLIRAGWERAERLEREQRLIAEQARLRERARIAQDMHDVLGHDLSLIALSAGALKLAPGLPDAHRATAQDIRARAAAAVERLGEVIGVLRQDTEAAPVRPAEAGIADLVDEAAAAGLAVGLHIEGAADGLPSMVGRAVHRVVQEALTNVAKHAPDSTAAVRLRHTAGETEVRVTNGPLPALVPDRRGEGYGLTGLDERVALAGGTFTYGPTEEGFAVVATFPHTAPAPPSRSGAATSRTAAGAVPAEQRGAHRRLGRTLAAAFMVPLVTAAVLGGSLRVWEAVSVSGTVLAPEDFARLRAGQDRAEVARHLPARQTVHRPTAAEPEARGTACEYYAMTADPFDDRSGDVYRLCFRAHELVSADAFTGEDVR